MNIAIVDDVQNEQVQLSALLRRYAACRGVSLSVACFSDAERFLADFQPYRYTAVFMDIYLAGASGLAAAGQMRQRDDETLLIFLTSSSEHMPEAFRFHAYDYILKPAEESRVFALMDDIFRKKGDATAYLSFRFGGQDRRLPYSDVVSVLSDGHNTQITDRRGTVYTPRMTFESIRQTLSSDSRFLLVLRGVLVNLDFVVDFEDGVCHLENGERLPINLRNRSKIEQIWQNYVIAQLRKRCADGRTTL